MMFWSRHGHLIERYVIEIVQNRSSELTVQSLSTVERCVQPVHTIVQDDRSVSSCVPIANRVRQDRTDSRSDRSELLKSGLEPPSEPLSEVGQVFNTKSTQRT
jgi:hypothetical protein